MRVVRITLIGGALALVVLLAVGVRFVTDALHYGSRDLEPYDTTFEDLLISKADFRDAVAHPSFQKYTHACFWAPYGVEPLTPRPLARSIKASQPFNPPLVEDVRWPIIFFNAHEFATVSIEKFEIPLGLEGTCCCFAMDEIRVLVDVTPLAQGTGRGEITVDSRTK